MSLHGKIGGTWRSGILWGKVAGVWKQMTVHGRVSGTWKNMTPASANLLTTNPSDGSDVYLGTGVGSATVTINKPTSANWTFTLLSGSATNVSFGASTGLSTTVSVASGTVEQEYSATYRVTDTITGWFVDVYVSAKNTNFP